MPVIFAVSVIAALGGVQLWLWAHHRDQRWLADWGAGHLVGGIGILFLGARGALPDLLSIDFGNAMLTLAFALLHAGARRFEGRPVSLAFTVAGSVIWLLACRVDVFYASLEARTFLASLLGASYTAAAAMEFLRPRSGRILPSRRALGVLIAASALLLIARAPLALLLPFDTRGGHLPQADWLNLLSALHLTARAAAAILMVALAKEEAEDRATLALMQARDQEAEANLRKSRFLTRMSHELRTPLNAVLGMAQVMVADPDLDPDSRARAGVIEQGGRHLLAIVTDLLDLARLEAGRMAPVPEPIDLGACLSGTLALLMAPAANKGLRLELSLASGLHDRVLADPRQLRQMLLNLLGNAVKFTPAGGTILLAAASQPGGLTRLSVTDTGPGVPEALRAHLFEDFARGEDMSAVEGSGLGLAITAAMARAMGGRVEFSPAPEGRGACFFLTLPLPPTR